MLSCLTSHPTKPCFNETGRMWGLVRDQVNRRIWQLQVTVVPQWSVIIRHQQTSVHHLISLFNAASISRSCTLFWSGQWNSKPVLCYPAGNIRWTVIYAFCWIHVAWTTSSITHEHHRHRRYINNIIANNIISSGSSCSTLERKSFQTVTVGRWVDNSRPCTAACHDVMHAVVSSM